MMQPAAPVDAVIVAAGTGQRSGQPVPKALAHVAGQPLLRHAVQRLRDHPAVRRIAVVMDPHWQDQAQAALSGIDPIMWVAGGPTRAHSVHNGLKALADSPPRRVLVHDAARAFMPTRVVDDLLAALNGHAGAVPALPVPDSLKQIRHDVITHDIDRSTVVAAQTPQAFDYAALCMAYDTAGDLSKHTDDASIAHAAGLSVAVVPGHADGAKLTYADDFMRAERLFAPARTRIGSGFDVHRFGPGDHLWLCGVRIAHSHALIGHSDADVGLHAATDAVLGALALGDIGQHFPPSDARWRGVSSDIFLRHALDLARQLGWQLTQLDITLICEAPKITPHRDALRARVADICGVSMDAISVKATTTEGLGLCGRGEGLAAQALAMLHHGGYP